MHDLRVYAPAEPKIFARLRSGGANLNASQLAGPTSCSVGWSHVATLIPPDLVPLSLIDSSGGPSVTSFFSIIFGKLVPPVGEPSVFCRHIGPTSSMYIPGDRH